MGYILRLRAPLQKRGPAGAFVLTDEQVAALAEGKKAFPVNVTVNGATLALRLARMGGENLIGLSRAARQQAVVDIDQTYDVQITYDASERTVDVPPDLTAALAADATAQAAFAALPYTHRKQWVDWVTEAKREATRADRVAKTIEMIREGRSR